MFVFTLVYVLLRRNATSLILDRLFAQVTRGTLILLVVVLYIYILQIPIGILDILGFGSDLGGRV